MRVACPCSMRSKSSICNARSSSNRPRPKPSGKPKPPSPSSAALGFSYQLVEGESVGVGFGASFGASFGAGGADAVVPGRRSGVRDRVLGAIKSYDDGIARADLLEVLGAKGDKRAEQSVSNALASMKRAGLVTAEDGIYRAID